MAWWLMTRNICSCNWSQSFAINATGRYRTKQQILSKLQKMQLKKTVLRKYHPWLGAVNCSETSMVALLVAEGFQSNKEPWYLPWTRSQAKSICVPAPVISALWQASSLFNESRMPRKGGRAAWKGVSTFDPFETSQIRKTFKKPRGTCLPSRF